MWTKGLEGDGPTSLIIGFVVNSPSIYYACGAEASLDTDIPLSLGILPKEMQHLLWNKGLPDTPHNQRCLRMLAWMGIYGGPGNTKPIIAIFNIKHWNNIDSGGLRFWMPNISFALVKFVAGLKSIWWKPNRGGNPLGLKLQFSQESGAIVWDDWKSVSPSGVETKWKWQKYC